MEDLKIESSKVTDAEKLALFAWMWSIETMTADLIKIPQEYFLDVVALTFLVQVRTAWEVATNVFIANLFILE